MNRSYKKIGAFLFFILCLLVANCSRNPYNIRSAISSQSSSRKILVGYIENRDLKSLKQAPKNFKDLLQFELIKNGFNLVPYRKKNAHPGNKESSKDAIGSLPESLRRIAGENSYEDYKEEKLLDREEIRSLFRDETFDILIQGSISIQSNDQILDRKEYNYIFLHIFDHEGNNLGMISSTFDNKILYESELMKKVAEGLAFELKKNSGEMIALQETKHALKVNSKGDN
ncbi:lipoprotein [Leptospira ilyithenensis]|uniref:Lipoprotein n=1 Tax=Leptospira ilyithenensis TaxID=2484901 RepID=A0A4R9LNM2_9LEPT|nr:lipoprotein [Leptospira ilyithenensis]TGN08483.1 lipoprotein [Leptospira ilyithenensis]